MRRRVVCAGQLAGGAPQDIQIRRLAQHLGRRDPGAACVGCSAARNTLLGSSLPIRLRTRALPPVMQEHGAAAGTSREGDHAEVSDVLIGSVEAAKAAWCAATGSS